MGTYDGLYSMLNVSCLVENVYFAVVAKQCMMTDSVDQTFLQADR